MQNGLVKILIIVSIFLLISSGCRQIFGDRTAPDSLIEPLESSSIIVTQPIYGTTYKPGEQMIIRWSASINISHVDILLFKKGLLITHLADALSNNNLYNWKIPDEINNSVHYLIHVVDHNNPENFGISERFIIQD